MMALTHMAIGAAAACFALSPSPWAIGLGVLGSQLPDIDTSNSWIGSVCFPISRWIEKRYPHRTITHCLLATIALTVVSAAAGFLLPELLGSCWLALPIGHASACFSDCFTKKGVQLFYPKPAWCVAGINPHRRLATGSVGEYFVLIIAIGALAANIHFSTTGGWVRTATQAIGLREGAIEVYNAEVAKHHVFAEIKGYWSLDRARADGDYWILGMDSGEFVVTDGKGVYKTATNIVAEKLTAKPKGDATTITKTLSFNEQEPEAQLNALMLEYPQSAIYLSGSIGVDFPEEIQLSTTPKELQTLTINGERATMRYCAVQSALIQLAGQYATGELTAHILTPKPI
jgi:inner membrane protein